ncbi:MAG: hypothetical protein ACTS2F_10895 [Thainema sp.]
MRNSWASPLLEWPTSAIALHAQGEMSHLPPLGIVNFGIRPAESPTSTG